MKPMERLPYEAPGLSELGELKMITQSAGLDNADAELQPDSANPPIIS